MLFTSLEYALLLAVTFAGVWALPRRATPAVLLAASVVFYASWSVPYLGLLGASIAVGWGAGLLAEGRPERGRTGRPRLAVTLACVLLLGTLAWFKYADFLLSLVAPFVDGVSPLGLVLPLAISFYTFQILAYVVDVARGGPAERSLLRFALFIAFFPQLIAGPIVRARQLLPQLREGAVFDAARVQSGLLLLCYGLAKKLVVADNLGVYVDRVYAAPQLAGGLDVVAATVAFGAQIYCDFSGYTDIARGSARLLGFELPVNFRSPYAARSITEFWRRWHVTLSTWLRDYLYVPLGGNRVSRPRLYVNLFVTLLLGGLWHGASLTFVLWGAFHGALVVVERALGVARGERRTPVWGLLVTFPLVQAGWLLFRAGDVARLEALLARVAAAPIELHPWLGTLEFLPLVALAYGLHALSAWLRARPGLEDALARPLLAAPALATSVLLIVLFGGAREAFIYFQF